MPELPEVETVRRGLERVARGARIASVEVSGRRSVRRQDKETFIAALVDRRIDAVLRHGKYLVVRLDDFTALVIHLRMSGQLRYLAADVAYEPHTHIVIGLGEHELRFVDPRTFGEMFSSHLGAEGGLPVELAHLGPDPLNDGIDAAGFATTLRKRKVALKVHLLDQRAIVGIGNIYGDEICHRARLRPDRRCDTIDAQGIEALRQAIGEVLEEAVRLRGSSLQDVSYRDLFGDPGAYQHQHRVYGRQGEPCERCGGVIVRARVGGRSAHFCPTCQA